MPFALLPWLLLLAGALSISCVPQSFCLQSGLPSLSRPTAPLNSKLSRRDGDVDGQPSVHSADIVTELLRLIKDTDRGVTASEEQKVAITGLIEKLEDAGAGRDYFADKSAYGKYEVAYVGASSSRVANPAGGRWRGRIGRLFFPTRGLYQHILPTNEAAGSEANANAIAVNLLGVAVLGLIPLTVVLRGSASLLEAEERNRLANERETPGGLSVNAVRANFDAPRIAVGSRGLGLCGLARYIPPLRFRAGPKSSVVLDAPYADERIRIGKGASGIRFVFCRTDDAAADEWQRVVAGRPIGAKTCGALLMFVGLIGAARAFLCNSARRAIPLVPWLALCIGGLACMKSSGGIVRGQPRNADYPSQGYSPVDE